MLMGYWVWSVGVVSLQVANDVIPAATDVGLEAKGGEGVTVPPGFAKADPEEALEKEE